MKESTNKTKWVQSRASYISNAKVIYVHIYKALKREVVYTSFMTFNGAQRKPTFSRILSKTPEMKCIMSFFCQRNTDDKIKEEEKELGAEPEQIV